MVWLCLWGVQSHGRVLLEIWTYDIFLDPPNDAEFVENFEELFNDGMPLFASLGMFEL